MSKQLKAQKKAIKQFNKKVDDLAKTYTKKSGVLRWGSGIVSKEFKASKDQDSVIEATERLFNRASSDFEKLKAEFSLIEGRMAELSKDPTIKAAVLAAFQDQVTSAGGNLESKIVKVKERINYKEIKQAEECARKSGDKDLVKKLQVQVQKGKEVRKEAKKAVKEDVKQVKEVGQEAIKQAKAAEQKAIKQVKEAKREAKQEARKEDVKQAKEKLGLQQFNKEVDDLATKYTKKSGLLRWGSGIVSKEFKASKDQDSVIEATERLFNRASSDFEKLKAEFSLIEGRMAELLKDPAIKASVLAAFQDQVTSAGSNLESKIVKVKERINYKEIKQAEECARKSGDKDLVKDLRVQVQKAKETRKVAKEVEKDRKKDFKKTVQDRGFVIQTSRQELRNFIAGSVVPKYEAHKEKNKLAMRAATDGSSKQGQKLIVEIAGREAMKIKVKYNKGAFRGFVAAVRKMKNYFKEAGMTGISELEVKMFIESAKSSELGFDVSQDNISGLLSDGIFQDEDSVGKSIEAAKIISDIQKKYGGESAQDLFDQIKVNSKEMQRYDSQDFTTKYILIPKIISKTEELLELRRWDEKSGVENPDSYFADGAEFSIDKVAENESELSLKVPKDIQHQFDSLNSAIGQQKEHQYGIVQKILLETQQKISDLREIRERKGLKPSFSISGDKGKVWCSKDSTMFVAEPGVDIKFCGKDVSFSDMVDDSSQITKRRDLFKCDAKDLESIKGKKVDFNKLLKLTSALNDSLDRKIIQTRKSGWTKVKDWFKQVGSKLAAVFSSKAKKQGYQKLSNDQVEMAPTITEQREVQGEAVVDVDEKDLESLKSHSRSPSPPIKHDARTDQGPKEMPHVDQAIKEGHVPHKEEQSHVAHAISHGHAHHHEAASYVRQALSHGHAPHQEGTSYVQEVVAHGHHPHFHEDDHSYSKDMQERRDSSSSDHDH